ncbi:MAG: stage III sporulation protein AC [Ruminococcaceae bacterium]|nr:stage III sporulation protein AC [Oscillospiraceae bacterium]
MDIAFILKIAGVGLTVAIAYQMLQRMGRDEQAILLSLAGVVMVLLLMVNEIERLFSSVRSIFGV